jgi:hypothetical protein
MLYFIHSFSSESNLTFTERDLNKEIERLIEETTLQKRRIAELEIKLASRVTNLGTVPRETRKKVHPQKLPKSKSPMRAPKDKRDDGIHKSSSSPENGVKVRYSLSLCNVYSSCIWVQSSGL